MKAEQELAEVAPAKDTLLTIGVFDGVHVGHKYLFSQLIKQAKERGLLSGVVTFRQHPQEVLKQATRLPRLTTTDDKTALIKAVGVDFVVALTFTKETAQIGARDFMTLLQKHLRMKGLVVGADFALGKGREGNIENLRKLGSEMGFSLTVISPIIMNGQVASSSAIRAALTSGDMDTVHRLLGRYFSLSGPVVAGEGRGRKLGFPTANMQVDRQQALPTDGIYATIATVEGKTYKSVTNIGRRPTFDGVDRSVEVFLLDFNGDLYGKKLRIDIVERLREEKKFNSVDELMAQITKDVEHGRKVLADVK